MRKLVLALCLLLPAGARADVAEVTATHILPGYTAFAASTAALADAAALSCDTAALDAPFNAAWDAWMGVAHLHLGPVEADGRLLAISFWPDPKGLGAKAQAALLRDGMPPDAAGFAEVSVAARGLAGLERLLFPAKPLPPDAACALIRATADDLARMAAAVRAEWDAHAQVLLTAGQPGNATYLTMTEARQHVLTQLAGGLEFVADQRLGRPMGTFDRPRPERAEARAAGRSLVNVRLSLTALRALAVALEPESPQTQAAVDRAMRLTGDLDDPVFAGVATPQGRLKVEAVQQAVRAARDAVLAEFPPRLGVGLGFNAADGD